MVYKCFSLSAKTFSRLTVIRAPKLGIRRRFLHDYLSSLYFQSIFRKGLNPIKNILLANIYYVF
ncbi:hypothetical protein ALC62_07042 [Cyphomyrmex costatus]|uniref:Uncharacterized protein n=1 Tax=Cyphomyrmex costatus TaxID=456900 RepID=A0A151II53_9HYME|nr:hypothetical protein ALC62_07042 [Cyphomyrmex costatus]